MLELLKKLPLEYRIPIWPEHKKISQQRRKTTDQIAETLDLSFIFNGNGQRDECLTTFKLALIIWIQFTVSSLYSLASYKNPPPKTVQDNCGSYPPKQARFPQWASSCSLPSTTRHREALEGDKPPSANTRGRPTPPRTRSLAPSLLHSSFPLILKGREARCPVHPPSSFQPTSLPHRCSIFQDNGLTGAGRM